MKVTSVIKTETLSSNNSGQTQSITKFRRHYRENRKGQVCVTLTRFRVHSSRFPCLPSSSMLCRTTTHFDTFWECSWRKCAYYKWRRNIYFSPSKPLKTSHVTYRHNFQTHLHTVLFDFQNPQYLCSVGYRSLSSSLRTMTILKRRVLTDQKAQMTVIGPNL